MKQLLILFFMLNLIACTPEQPIPTLNPRASGLACSSMVENALNLVKDSCVNVGRNRICYGNHQITATLRDGYTGDFSEPGQQLDIIALNSIELAALNVDSSEWGITLAKVQAGLPDTLPGQNVTMLMFGDTQIRAEEPIENVQAFYFVSAITPNIACNEAPPDGLLVQSPDGAINVRFYLNNVLIELASTVFIQAVPDGEMLIRVLEGQATVTAQGMTHIVAAGALTRIPLDGQGLAVGPPSQPEAYDAVALRTLPIQSLERLIVIAPPLVSTTLPPATASNTPEPAGTPTSEASLTPVVSATADAPTRTPDVTFDVGGDISFTSWNNAGTRILVATRDGNGAVWDTQTGAQVFTIGTPSNFFMSRATWSRDDSRILTWNGVDTAIIWDGQSGTELFRLQPGGAERVDDAAWNADETRILTSGAFETRIWDAQTGAELLILRHQPDSVVFESYWNQDGSRIVSISTDSVDIWDTQTGVELVSLPHESSVDQAIWNADGGRLLTANLDGIAQVWDVQTGTILFSVADEGTMGNAIWNADGTRILTRDFGGRVRVWDGQSGAELFNFESSASLSSGIPWSTDGTRFLTQDPDGSVQMRDTETGEPVFTIPPDPTRVFWSWSPNATQIMAVNIDTSVQIWDGQTGAKLVNLVDVAAARNMTWNQDETRMLAWSFEGLISVWSN